MAAKETVPRGVIYCCVPLCHSYSGKVVNGRMVKLHKLPKDSKARKIWIDRLRNVRQNFSAKPGTRVCSLHFNGEQGPKPWCQFPTLFPSKPAPKSPRRRTNPLSNKIHRKLHKEDSSKTTQTAAVCIGNEPNFDHCFHDYIPTIVGTFDSGDISRDGSRDTGVQFRSDCVDNGIQTAVEMKDVGIQVNLPLLTAEDLKGDDPKTRFYTGFVNFGTFMVIFTSISQIAGKLNYWNGKDSLKRKEYLENDVKQKPGPQRKMRPVDEYLMVFMRLRLGLLEQDLAQRFCVSVSTVSRILITWYNVLAVYLKHLIVWPSKDIIAANMPECFKKFPNTRVIIDCTEFFIEIPSSLVNQTITYSSYKSHNTFKLLVGISPTGVVTFLSKLWGGNASDKQIVKESGILNLLEKGDSVMADKGFTIQDLLDPLGVTLNMPPKRESNKQLSRQEVEQTRRIAAVRIHVERKMEQIKNFRILQGVIPATEWQNANNIVLICAALSNLEPPLVT